jgi:hypothetical protein
LKNSLFGVFNEKWLYVITLKKLKTQKIYLLDFKNIFPSLLISMNWCHYVDYDRNLAPVNEKKRIGSYVQELEFVFF